MNILLDTHVFIWWLKDDSHLSKKARSTIINAESVYVSSISIWEAAIKVQLGKLNAAIPDLVDSIESQGFLQLPLTAKHAAMVAELPDHHRDPFDRVLIAQAMTEPLRLITADKTLARYSELVDVIA